MAVASPLEVRRSIWPYLLGGGSTGQPNSVLFAEPHTRTGNLRHAVGGFWPDGLKARCRKAS